MSDKSSSPAEQPQASENTGSMSNQLNSSADKPSGNDSAANDPELEIQKIQLDRYKAKLDFLRYIIVSGFIALAIAAIPPFFQYATKKLEESRAEAERLTNNEKFAAEQRAKEEQFREEYIKAFLDQGINQDVELRLRLAEYFSSVSAESYKKGWSEYLELLKTKRKKIRDKINKLEREWNALANAPPDQIQPGTTEELKRQLEWAYKEVGYIEPNRSVSVNPRAPERSSTASYYPGTLHGSSEIRAIVAQSPCAAINWRDRGRAPRPYIEGVTLVFARAICQPQRTDVKVVSAPMDDLSSNYDSLAVYKDIFEGAGMRNDTAGPDTLRHTYALLIGLGMRESSGNYCAGRDPSAEFATADSAEAGPFQISYNSLLFSPVLPSLFQSYSADRSRCLSDELQTSIACRSGDVVGSGPGAEWQILTKNCPAFATEYAAVLLRKGRRHFGPINRREVELRPECDSMLQTIQTYIEQHPEVCAGL